MVTTGPLAALMATATEVPEATVVLFIRKLREDGLIATGARGVNAARLSYLEVARLLTALLVTDKPAKAAIAARDFGSLRRSAEIKIPKGRSGAFVKLCRLDAADTLEQAIASLIEAFAEKYDTPAFRGMMSGALPVVAPHGFLPVVEIRIDVTGLAAAVLFKDVTFEFIDPLLIAAVSSPYVDVQKVAKGDSTETDKYEEKNRLTDAHFEKSHRYFRKIKTVRSAFQDVLDTLGQAMGESE